VSIGNGIDRNLYRFGEKCAMIVQQHQ